MPYLISLQYFAVPTVSPINNESYKADTLVVFIQDGTDMQNPSFVFSGSPIYDEALSSYSFVNTFSISDVNYTLSLSISKEYGIQCVFDYPHYFGIDTSAISFFCDEYIGSPHPNPDSSLSSLNGNYGTLPDGTSVLVEGQEGFYTVVSSVMGWDNPQTGSLIINYNLINEFGKVLLAPYVLVQKAS